MRTFFLLFILFMAAGSMLHAQADGVKLSSNNSILSLESDNKGILIPRMTEVQKSAISNAIAGLIVYQTDGQKGMYQYNGNDWIHVGHNPTPYQVGDGISMLGDTIKLTIPGQSPGDMFYYNGNAWIRIPKGQEGQILGIVNGVPTWIN